jgi:hypothetical protein
VVVKALQKIAMFLLASFILFISLVLPGSWVLIGGDAYAGQGMMPGMGVKGYAGGGGAASGSYDPTTHVAVGETIYTEAYEACTTDCYTYIDDGTRSPTTPTLAEGIRIPDEVQYTGTFYTCRTDTITGTIATVRFFVYCSGATDTVGVEISPDGSTWSSRWTSAVCSTGGWQSHDFSVSYSSNPVYIRLTTPTMDKMPYIETIYVTVNP